jgi:hypothetical protein
LKWEKETFPGAVVLPDLFIYGSVAQLISDIPILVLSHDGRN